MNALPATFRSQPVIPYAPNADGDRPNRWDRPSAAVETPSGLSAVSALQATGIPGTETIQLGYVGLTRAETRTLEAFVADRAGRKTGFWCPTFQHDFYATDSGIGSTAVHVREWGYVDNLHSLQVAATFVFPFRYFAGYYAGASGSKWGLCKWNSSISAGGTDGFGNVVKVYTSADANGFECAGADVWSQVSGGSAKGLVLMRLLWVRFAEDAITTEWNHPALANLTLRVVSVPQETPA